MKVLTQNNDTKKVYSLRFHKEIITEFDTKITRQYGTTKKYRIQVLEQLMKEYTENTNKDKDKKIQEQQQQIKDLEQNIKEITRQLQEKRREHEQLTEKYNDIQEQIQEQQQQTKKMTNKYTHQVEVTNKLQQDQNQQLQKIEKYSYFIGAVTHMSLLDRLLGRYPSEVKELETYKKE